MIKRNPVPLAKGTRMKRAAKKTAIKRAPTRKQIAARKRFAKMAKSGELAKLRKRKVLRKKTYKKTTRKKVARKKTAHRIRRKNPAPKYTFDDMKKQTKRLSSALGKPLKVKTFFGEDYLTAQYQILWENGRPYSMTLALPDMRVWLHAAISTALR